MIHFKNIILSILLLIVVCSCVKFEPIVRYTEPDDTFEKYNTKYTVINSNL